MESNTFNSIVSYAPTCKQISADHGFWDEGDNRSKGEMVALMLCELSESVEAHRKPKSLKQTDYETWVLRNDEVHRADIVGEVSKTSIYQEWYTSEIKGSIGEEMADTVIRILDYVYGWNIPVFEREYRKETTGNFAHDVLHLQYYTLCAFHNEPAKDWGYLLAAILKFCKWYDIDLEQHMAWKMMYNRNRPYKHNKQY